MDKKKLPFIITIFSVTILLSLSLWQLYRYNYKLEIIKKIESRINIPEKKISCKKLIELSKKRDVTYRKFVVTGTLENSKSLFVYYGPRVFKGEAGYLVVTPFKCDNQFLMVDQGWIPLKFKKKILSSKDTNKSLRVSVLPSEKKKIFTPTNDKEKNIWFYIDTKEIGNHLKISLPEFYLMKAKMNKDYPIGKSLTLKIRNDHLKYAFTWFALCVSIIVIYNYYTRKKK